MTDIVFTFTLIILEIIFSAMVLKTLKKAGGNNSLLISLGIVFSMWLVSTYMMLTNGFFSSTGIPQIIFTMGVALPVVLGLLASKFCKPLTVAINKVPISDFLALQQMRAVFGGMFFFSTSLPCCLCGFNTLVAWVISQQGLVRSSHCVI